MNIHQDELALARAFSASANFETLTDDQVLKIMNRGRALFHWFKAHRRTHYAISAAVLLFIFLTDYAVQVQLPRWFIDARGESSTSRIVIGALVSGAAHSWLLYSLIVYSIHDGAAHKTIFPPEGPISRLFDYVSANLCRISAAEPNHYSTHHMMHHARFGTEEDAEFLNFVRPRRYWPTFLPLAYDINYSDFIVHRPLDWTRERLLSLPPSLLYNGLYAWYAWNHFGALFTIVVYVVMLPHFGFLTDRLRQFTEHNLMPLENKNGSRSFGLGFWGLFVGGGPWGSPCHWAHHLVPSIPWYQQLILHRYVVSLLTPKQRTQFLIEPVVGFPKLWWHLIQEPNAFAARAAARTTNVPTVH